MGLDLTEISIIDNEKIAETDFSGVLSQTFKKQFHRKVAKCMEVNVAVLTTAFREMEL